MKDQYWYGHLPVQILFTIHILAYPILVMVICAFWYQNMYKFVLTILIVVYQFVHKNDGKKMLKY
jgi:hypothetical protein